MTTDLRDQFAIAAMQGMSANPNGEDWTFTQIAEWAYKQADAMIAEREKDSVESVHSIKQDLIHRIKNDMGVDIGSTPLTAKHLLRILIDRELPF